MRTIAVVPVKRFAAAKERLGAGGIDEERRRALAGAMLGDVLEGLSRSRSLDRVLLVTGEPKALRIAREFGVEAVGDPEDAGHSAAAERGVERAMELGADCVALLPGDCPMVSARELDTALAGVPDPYVGVVPDRHGSGTNGLILRPPTAIRPSFGEGSRDRHVRLAREAGVAYGIEGLPSLGLDLDTPADIVALTMAIETGRGSAPRTAKVLGI